MSNNRMPAVSVVIPAYNSSPYIEDALDSVFAQTFTDYEVIVVNDGSPDAEELKEVLEPYREKIVYLEQENQGTAGARNAGIGAARGRYIALLDPDGERIKLKASQDSVLLVLNGEAIDEPVASYGPFVMNTRAELSQAVDDYRAGKMGHLQ